MRAKVTIRIAGLSALEAFTWNDKLGAANYQPALFEETFLLSSLRTH